MHSIRKIVICACAHGLLAAVLAGCGQSGALYLPPPQADAGATAAAQQAAPASPSHSSTPDSAPSMR
ncbi:LPS translocon maturation chaperone LptM [Vandammella animalimorsus]|uniref:LPS translocon maturation chaperone LptM n=1 Tax=Vandammella animalimorsus TaxID=2029117 RepID=UPI000BAA3960|nr:lipoprotein [Vandammella animalimorsus]